jgi:heterotetrameric sarcosine oxidase gamma subunit
LGPPHPAEPVSWPANLPDEGLVTVVDVTHGLTLLQLVGRASAAVLAKLCPVDLHDSVTPNGSALRSLVAGVVVGVIRDDVANQHRYWVFSERSVGRYLFDALLDAGAEFGIDVDGFSSDKF